MSDEELLKKWSALVERIGPDKATALLLATDMVRTTAAELWSGKRKGKPTKPYGRTRKALLDAVGKKAS